MTKDELKSIIEQPHTADKHHLPELLELSRQYPYSSPIQVLILLLLHRVNDLRYASELHERALALPNLRRLYTQLNASPATLAQNKKNLSQESSGSDGFGLIDAFLEQHPEDSSDIEELLDAATITPPTPQRPTEEKNTDDIISEFLGLGEKAEVIEATPDTPKTTDGAKAPQKSTSTEPIEAEEELFTETLARMYIRQGKYQRAERILTQINLEFPKKSGYFAEQLNFLKKLIENNSDK